MATNRTMEKAVSWSEFMDDAYASGRTPVVGTFDVAKLEQAAREKLKDSKDSFLYVFGSAGTGSTYAANRREFERWKIVPRMMREVSDRSLETTLFGVKYPSPLLIAPMGVHGLVHPEGETATAAAAGALGIPFVMSTAASRSIEAVAKASGSGPRWVQLYWPKSPDFLQSVLMRVKKGGFSALVFSVDSMMIGWRPHDLDTAFSPFSHGIGVHTGLTDPVFMAKFGLPPYPEDDKPVFPYIPARQEKLIRDGDEDAVRRAQVGKAFVREVLYKSKVWKDLDDIKKHWNGRLLLKGILSIEDAEAAIDHGVDGIIVSNHGGRQVDGSISALYALHQIMQSKKVREAQASGKLTVLFDSGIRTGSDVLKAIALGAQGVLYGRPVLYALALGGQAGVDAQLRAILADCDVTLGLVGCANLTELRENAGRMLVRD